MRKFLRSSLAIPFALAFLFGLSVAFHDDEGDPHSLTNPIDHTASLTIAWYEMKRGSTRLFTKVCPRSTTPDPSMATVAVHAGVSKLPRLLFTVKRWGGPVSAVIYLQSVKDVKEFVNFCLEHQRGALSQTDLHVYMEKPDSDGKMGMKAGYPHNVLRQLALDRITTDYFVTLDVDFMTPPNASRRLQGILQDYQSVREALRNETLMVLPAFDGLGKPPNEDRLDEVANDMLPVDKDQVKSFLKQKNIEPFHVKVFPMGHGPTNFEKWLTSSEPYYITDYVVRFEPYVLGQMSSFLPRYFQDFRGFGYNKWTWLLHAHLEGYQFGVLNELFLVHLPHTRPSEAPLPNYDAYNKYIRIQKKRNGWTNDDVDILLRKDRYIAPPSRPHLDERTGEVIPTLLQWTQQGDCVIGAVFGSMEITDTYVVGTSPVVEGMIANGSVITVQSGKRFYLSDEALAWQED